MKRLKKKIIIAALFVGMSLIFAGCSNKSMKEVRDEQEERVENKTAFLLSDDYIELDVVEAKWLSRTTNNFYGTAYHDEFIVSDSNKSMHKILVYDDELNGKFMSNIKE